MTSKNSTNCIEDDLFQVIERAIPPSVDGKVCIPISGGLDSRVLAAMWKNYRQQPIDLSYCQFDFKHPIVLGKQLESVTYARRIAELTHVKQFEAVCVIEDTQADRDAVKHFELAPKLVKSKMYTGLRLLSERVPDLKEYVAIVGHGMDVWSGNSVHLGTLFKQSYKNIDRETVQLVMPINVTELGSLYRMFFKDVIFPFWNEKLINYCLDMKLKERFHQRAYRRMLDLYFPDVASIPREGLFVPPNCSEFRYGYAIMRRWWFKL